MALLIVGILGALFGAFSLISSIFGFGIGAAQIEEMKQQNLELPEWAMWMTGAGGGAIQIVFVLAGIACSLFVAYAGLQMQKLKNRSLCQIASVIAMVPCLSPCCCLGLPIGIWAMIVLNKDDVRQSFT